MKRLASVALAVLFTLPVGASLRAAETGDFDGDGRLTIRDVLRILELWANPDLELAPGSFDAFAEYPPVATSPTGFVDLIAGSVYLESLRRTLSGPYPTYSFMHWPDTWLEDVEQEPLPVDPRVRIRLLPIETDGEHRVEVPMELTTTAAVRAFSLALESPDGMLRVPWVWIEQTRGSVDWREGSWGYLRSIKRGKHDLGDLTARVPPAGYLMSGGRYVVLYGFDTTYYHDGLPPVPTIRWDDPELAPGAHRIVTYGRLPIGTAAGRYPLRLLQQSQILLADGTLVSPTIDGDSEIAVSRDIESGWDEGLPPLRFDVQNRRVLGKVEFRFADARGMPVPEGAPVARGKPGDIITFRIQMRTETPLNTVSFQFRWPKGLLCTFERRPLNEQGGEPVIERPGSWCSDIVAMYLQLAFFLGGNWNSWVVPIDYTNLPDRPLEYFKPLNEWMDLWEAVLQIPEEPPLDVIPLEFVPRSRRWAGTGAAQGWVRAEFAPYTANYYGATAVVPKELWPDRDLWDYDIRYHNSFVLVEGGEPPPPPDHFIHIELEDAVVQPGGTAEVPVLASSADPLSFLRLVVDTDPESLSVEAVDTRSLNPETGLAFPTLAARTERVRVRSPDCPPEIELDPCWGVPAFVWFWESDPRYTYIDWVDFGLGGPYPGPNLTEIARLVVRAREDPRATEVMIRPAVMTIGEGPFAEVYESGGIADVPAPVVPFSPAREIKAATIRIGRNGFFRRGDVNHDGRLNISDGVVLLDYLFKGGSAPRCLDAADADDNGAVQLGDAVFLLLGFFEAGVPPPPPQVCGEDPTEDDVPCDEHVCRGG